MSATGFMRRRREEAARQTIDALTTVGMLKAFAEQERLGIVADGKTSRADLDRAVHGVVSTRTDAEVIAERAQAFAESFKAAHPAVHGGKEAKTFQVEGRNFFALRAEVKNLTGTLPKNKAEALELLESAGFTVE